MLLLQEEEMSPGRSRVQGVIVLGTADGLHLHYSTPSSPRAGTMERGLEARRAVGGRGGE